MNTKKLIFIFILTLFLGGLAFNSYAQQTQSATKPFGGKTLDVGEDVSAIKDKEDECDSKTPCTDGGTVVGATWQAEADVYCPGKAFSLNPIYPSSNTVKYYCIDSNTKNFTQNNPLKKKKWIIGLFNDPTSTEVGICTCIYDDGNGGTYSIQHNISTDLAHVVKSGNQK